MRSDSAANAPVAGVVDPDGGAGSSRPAGSTASTSSTSSASSASSTDAADPGAPTARRRDASGTRQLLLASARKLFAASSYQATTVRDIADDADVNVALISRYFGSKEGLFRACVEGAVNDLGDVVPADLPLERVARVIADRLAGPASARHPLQLLLLIRSSQDPEAERIRIDILRTFAERLATVAGWTPGSGSDRLLLNAQILLAATTGIAVLRSTSALEQLTRADGDDLVDPLRRLITALLAPDPTPADPD